MRRSLPLWLVLAALALPSQARAYTPGPYGCNLRWDHCFGDGGALNKNFACDTNAGSNVLVGSFTPAWDIGNVSGLEIVIYLAADAASLPAWWQFKNAGTCRQASLTMNATLPSSAANCTDWGQGLEAGGLAAYNIGALGPNTVRILAAFAVAPQNLQYLNGLQEYFGFSMPINHAKTVGTGSCSGCSTPVCIVFNQIRMTTPVLTNDRVLMGPSNFTDSHYATWQGGGNPSSFFATGCPAATPVKRSTWSSIKSLYR